LTCVLYWIRGALHLEPLLDYIDRFHVPQPEQEELTAIVESTHEAIVVAPFQAARAVTTS
jgi:hypothetical protein